MKFTKENIYKLFIQYRKTRNYTLNDLQDEILNLDDAPEKVVVPKCFDDYYKGFTERCGEGETAMRNAVQKVSQYGFGYPLENQHNERLDNDTDLSSWVLENKLVAIDAVLNGYTIAPEPLYVIPLENLVTSDGVQQYLSYDDTGQNYFASRPQGGLKQKYTNDELQDVPEGYKTFAVLVEEEK